VAVVQYTFTHKQYTERHNEIQYLEWNMHNKRIHKHKKEYIIYKIK